MMSYTGYDTISSINLFKEELLNSFLLHIPHASSHIPNYTGFQLGKIEENLRELTDWATDDIFNVYGIGKIVAPFSRLFCDVERFPDNAEPMHKFGRGFFYTKGHDGSDLRNISNVKYKDRVFREFYRPHHDLFYDEVNARLQQCGQCHIVDCHSFNDNDPIGSLINNPKSPDICIGVDDYHTPKYLQDYTVNFWESQGYSVEINDPYGGCIIPIGFYCSEKKVKGIMIEINKRLYMENNMIDPIKVHRLNKLMNGYFKNLLPFYYHE